MQMEFPEFGRCTVMLRAEQQLIWNESEYEKRHGQAKLAIFCSCMGRKYHTALSRFLLLDLRQGLVLTGRTQLCIWITEMSSYNCSSTRTPARVPKSWKLHQVTVPVSTWACWYCMIGWLSLLSAELSQRCWQN